FHARYYARAAIEFHAVADRAPTNDYALFCLGRSMQLLGRHREACQPLALACSLRPEREDYRLYRDRARRDALRCCEASAPASAPASVPPTRPAQARRCYSRRRAFEPARERRRQYRELAH